MRLVIIDDDPFVCGSLETILDAQPDIDVVAVGHDAAAAIQLYRQHQPDILLTDIQMPGSSGLEAAAQILDESPAARIVLLTTFADDEYIVGALRLGAKGYLIKQDVATIAPALRLVMSGQSVLGGEVLGRLDGLMRASAGRKDARGEGPQPPQPASSLPSASPPPPPPQPAPPPPPPATAKLDALTQREYEVTELVAEGLDNQEIAARLCISEGTARNLISVVLQKLDLKNRTQLAVLYYRDNRDNRDDRDYRDTRDNRDDRDYRDTRAK